MTAIYETCICGITLYLTATLLFKLLCKYQIIHISKLLSTRRTYIDFIQAILNIKVKARIKCKIEGN